MKVSYVERKCTANERTRDQIENKLMKLDRFFGGDSKAQIKLTEVKKGLVSSEITIDYKGITFRSQQMSDDLLAASETAIDNLVRQIRKNKTKLEKKMKRPSGEYEAFFANSVEVEEEYNVVREKNIELKPMDVDSAILHMNMVGHMFYLFLNSDSGEINLVYKRNNGDYGLLIPEYK